MALGKRPLRVVALVVLVFANVAQAGEPSPWKGGAASVTPFEAEAAKVARLVAGRPVSIECVDTPTWRALGSRLGFDASASWAVTTFHWSSQLAGPAPDGVARFSPHACRPGASFWRDPSDGAARACRTALRRARQTGVFGQRAGAMCDLWASRLTAVHVLSHESVHLRGFYDEAITDCAAVQITAWVAMALGADEGFSRSLAREYWTDFHLPRTGAYQSVSCHDGGSLDLFPDRSGWPTPMQYPLDLDAAFSALTMDTETADGGARGGTGTPAKDPRPDPHSGVGQRIRQSR